MTQKKTATPRRKKNAMRVCVLAAENGENLIIRSDPTVADIKKFVKENNRRSERPEQFPSASPILSAVYYESEYDIDVLAEAGTSVDLTRL